MRDNVMKCASILMGLALFVIYSVPIAADTPVQPFSRWGYAYDVGAMPLDHQDIYAWIDGVCYGNDTTGTGADMGLYDIFTYGDGDNPATTPDGIKKGG